jgi:dynein heavy chain
MGDFLFDDCQKFFFSRAGFDYELPGMGDLDVYRGMIETLPLTNSPAVFGLHPNAEIGYYTNATKEMWNALISLQPRSSAIGGGMSREEYIANVARDVLSKVPIVSLDIGSYDLLIIRNLLMDKNGGQPPTPCQVSQRPSDLDLPGCWRLVMLAPVCGMNGKLRLTVSSR